MTPGMLPRLRQTVFAGARSLKPITAIFFLAGLGLGVLRPAPSAAQTPAFGVVSGRVLDETSARPVSNVTIRILGTAIETLTDGQGFFRLQYVPIGEQRLSLDHLSYGEHRRRVLVERGGNLMLEAKISRQAIELAPLVVEALSDVDRRRIASGFRMNEVQRPEIEQAARAGLNLNELLRDRLPGAAMSGAGRAGACLEARGGQRASGCNPVTVILDGVMISDPGFLYQTMPVDQIARMELLSAGEAGVRYGSRSGSGVLLIETQRGPRRTPDALTEDNTDKGLINTFDWSTEAEPYPWLRVFGTAFAATAVGVGTSLLLADQCLWRTDAGSLGLRTRCDGAATVGIGFFSMLIPAAGGSLAARWSGQTDRSQGRLTPMTLATTLALTSGYLLVINGGTASEVAGAVVLSIGVPVFATLSDRIFRVLR